eukprot:4166473-Amphidinium_carterae.1
MKWALIVTNESVAIPFLGILKGHSALRALCGISSSSGLRDCRGDSGERVDQAIHVHGGPEEAASADLSQ